MARCSEAAAGRRCAMLHAAARTVRRRRRRLCRAMRAAAESAFSPEVSLLAKPLGGSRVGALTCASLKDRNFGGHVTATSRDQTCFENVQPYDDRGS
eukprot:4732283-Prymnesium_polylepis.1